MNKNAIPFDTRSPFDPSGIRLGTAAETTRGKGVKDMIKIARQIDAILRAQIATNGPRKKMKENKDGTKKLPITSNL